MTSATREQRCAQCGTPMLPSHDVADGQVWYCPMFGAQHPTITLPYPPAPEPIKGVGRVSVGIPCPNCSPALSQPNTVEVEPWTCPNCGSQFDDVLCIYGDVHVAIRERDAANAEARRWSLALQSLTPGGSEFVDDPERCVQFVRETRDAQHQKRGEFRGYVAVDSDGNPCRLCGPFSMKFGDAVAKGHYIRRCRIVIEDEGKRQ